MRFYTTTENGRFAFGIFTAFAKFERELVTERAQSEITAARSFLRLHQEDGLCDPG